MGSCEVAEWFEVVGRDTGSAVEENEGTLGGGEGAVEAVGCFECLGTDLEGDISFC